MAKRKNVLDALGVQRAVTRVAHEILEANMGIDALALVGIRSGGVIVSQMLAREIKKIESVDVPVGIVDITLYRDDLSVGTHHPTLRSTEIDFSVDGKKLVLVDDVLYTGRSTRAAMDALIDLGRPRAIRLAVLVDRVGREFPIQADYAGYKSDADPGESVQVRLVECDGKDEVMVE